MKPKAKLNTKYIVSRRTLVHCILDSEEQGYDRLPLEGYPYTLEGYDPEHVYSIEPVRVEDRCWGCLVFRCVPSGSGLTAAGCLVDISQDMMAIVVMDDHVQRSSLAARGLALAVQS